MHLASAWPATRVIAVAKMTLPSTRHPSPPQPCKHLLATLGNIFRCTVLVPREIGSLEQAGLTQLGTQLGLRPRQSALFSPGAGVSGTSNGNSRRRRPSS